MQQTPEEGLSVKQPKHKYSNQDVHIILNSKVYNNVNSPSKKFRHKETHLTCL